MPEREVQLGLDDLAGLADLLAVRDPARIDGGTGRADGATERRGQLLDDAEAVRAADAAAAGHDDPGLLDRRGCAPASLIRSDDRTAGSATVAVGRVAARLLPVASAGAAVVTFGRTVTIPRPVAEAGGRDRACRRTRSSRPIGPSVGPVDRRRVDQHAQPGQRRDGAGQIAAVGARADEDRDRAPRPRRGSAACRCGDAPTRHGRPPPGP